jgi:hypothetical protein
MSRFALLWAAAVFALAGEPAKSPAAPPTLRVPISVQSDSILTSKDFTAFVYGVDSAKIARIRTPDDDLVLMVVMDVVGDLALVDPARHSLADRVRELPSNVHVGLLRAQEGLQVLLDPTPDRDAFATAILNMPVAGKAGLLDTIATASRVADTVGAKTGVRVAILYVTDSDVRNYREDFTNPVINSSDSRDLSRKFPEGLIREKISRTDESLAVFQTPVFIVHIAYSASQLNEAYQTGLLQLATSTGATATFCRSSAEIPAAIAEAVSQIVSQYRVHVQLPAKAPRSVSVSLSSGDRPLTYRTRFTLR